MALTAVSDLYGAVHEDGFNRLVRHVMLQRPSLFNYGTQWVANKWWERLCKPPKVAPVVFSRQNPVVSVEDPLPLLGTGGAYGLDFAAQLTNLRIDFHPGTIQLPPELGTLDKQQFAIQAEVCGGIGCPNDEILDRFPPAPQPPIKLVDGHPDERPRDERPKEEERPKRPPITLPTDELHCFCLELFVVGHVERSGPPGHELVAFKVDGVEIVEIEPKGLESSLECYLHLLLHYVILPRLRIALPVFVVELGHGLPNLTLRAETAVSPNPAIEDDQLRVFADLEVGP